MKNKLTFEELKKKIAEHPRIAKRIKRMFLMLLQKREVLDIEELHDDIIKLEGGNPTHKRNDNSNIQSRDRWDKDHKKLFDKKIIELAAKTFTKKEIDNFINFSQRKDAIWDIADTLRFENVPSGLVKAKLDRLAAIPKGTVQFGQSEVIGTRVDLIKLFLSDNIDYLNVAKNYITIRMMKQVTDRIIGFESGNGRIGGKAAGILLASAILFKPQPDDPIDFRKYVAIPDSYFIRSDVFERLIDINDISNFRSHKYKSQKEVDDEFPVVKDIIKNSEFPQEVESQLKAILSEIGENPLIMRSSSYLEDNHGHTFSGKYNSVFVGNQGSMENRLAEALGGALEVYSSVFNPSAIAYRRSNNLLDYNETMSVLLQKVVGYKHGDWFLPPVAGVAYSHNEFRWTNRIKKEDGAARIVFGLGTRAVDRVGNDYPKMVALGSPTLKPYATLNDEKKYSQRYVDVISLSKNTFETVEISEVLAGGGEFPESELVFSIMKDGYMVPYSPIVHDGEKIVNFKHLLENSPFAHILRAVLIKLERAYKMPIDVEFIYMQGKLYLLQCRPQAVLSCSEIVAIPQNINHVDTVFTANTGITSGAVRDVRYVIYVDALKYKAASNVKKSRIARIIGKLNYLLEKENFILVGPGRWGSSNIDLGVQVSYADISNTKMLVEVAREIDSFTPEVSYGTHFFQDLVESSIYPLALYPDDPKTIFNEAFFVNSQSVLLNLIPKASEVENEIKVINVPANFNGKKLTIIMNSDEEKGIAYLDLPKVTI